MDEANKTVAIASARSHQHRWRGSPEHKTIVDLARTSLCCKLRWIANICEHLTAKHLADATSDDRAHLNVIMRSWRRAASRWRFAGSPRCASPRSFWSLLLEDPPRTSDGSLLSALLSYGQYQLHLLPQASTIYLYVLCPCPCPCPCSCSARARARANLCLPRSLLRAHARTIMLLGCRGCPALHHLPNATCFTDGGVWVDVRGMQFNDRESI